MALSYVTVGSNDVVRARGFYDAVLAVIGGHVVMEILPHALCYQLRGGGRIWVTEPQDGAAAVPGNGVMVGLMCADPDEVRAAHAAGLKAGGTSEGEPGPRPIYGPDFFGGYLRDLDGNKLSLVHFPEG